MAALILIGGISIFTPAARAADSDGDGVADEVEIADGTNSLIAGDRADFSLSLAARYAFDGNAVDSSGKAAHGSLSGSPVMTQGVRGQAVQFDGVDDHFARNPAPTNSLPFTWCLWIKAPASAFGTSIPAIELGQSGRKSPSLEFNLIDATHCKVGLYLWRNGYGGGSSAVLTCDDTTGWHHLALTNDAAGTRKLYFDGVEVASVSEPAYGEVNNTLYLGGDVGLGYRSKYQADEVRLYNRALSGAEIAAMRANQSQAPAPPSFTTDLPALMERPEGTPVHLSVGATGYPADFIHQWYFNDAPVNVENGGQSAALDFTVGTATAGRYRVRVSNSAGFRDSAACLVAPSEDGDADGLGDWRELHVYGTDPAKQDSDADGLSDGVEVNDHATNPANPDSDNDGYYDGYELAAGTAPNEAASTPAGRSRIMTSVEFRFSAAAGRQYRIESSAGLDVWQPVESGIPGNGGEIQRFYSIEGAPRRFLRAVEETAAAPD